MTCRGNARRRIALGVALVVGTAAAGASELPSLRPYEGAEAFVEAINNRLRIIVFEDDDTTACPQIASLIASGGPRLTVFTPDAMLRIAKARTGREGWQTVKSPEEAAGDPPEYDKEFVFANADCRYILTIRRFELRDGKETPLPSHRSTGREARELPPSLQRHLARIDALAKQRAERNAAAPPNADAGAQSDKDKATAKARAADATALGFTSGGGQFASPQHAIDFAGMFYFEPKGFGLYLANTPDELTIDSGKESAIGAYRIDIRNASSRVQLSLQKEIRTDTGWKRIFPK